LKFRPLAIFLILVLSSFYGFYQPVNAISDVINNGDLELDPLSYGWSYTGATWSVAQAHSATHSIFLDNGNLASLSFSPILGADVATATYWLYWDGTGTNSVGLDIGYFDGTSVRFHYATSGAGAWTSIDIEPDINHAKYVRSLGFVEDTADHSHFYIDDFSITYVGTTLPGIVSIGSSVAPLFSPNSRQGNFYHDGLYWKFFPTNTEATNYYASYSTSADGINWDDPTTVVETTAQKGWFISYWFNGTHIVYARVDASNDLKFRCGTPDVGGGITWDAVEQAVATTHDTVQFLPTICMDSANHVWIGYLDKDGANYYPYVIRSDAIDGTWSTVATFPYKLSTTSDSTWAVTVVPQTSAGQIVALYSRSGQKICAQEWSGAGWEAEDQSARSIKVGKNISAVNTGDDIEVAFLDSAGSAGWEIYAMVYDSATHVFVDEESIATHVEATTAPALMRGATAGTILCLYHLNSGGNGSILRVGKSGVSGSWDTPVEILNYAYCVYVYDTLALPVDLGNGKIPLSFGAYPTYTILFDLFSEPAPTVTSVSITFLDATNNMYSMYNFYNFICTVSVGTETINLIAEDTGVSTYFEIEFDSVANTWTIISGGTEIDITTGTWTPATGIAVFKVKTEWDFGDISNIDLTLKATNGYGTSGDVLLETDYFDNVSTLIATMNCGTPNVFLNTAVTIYGDVTYPNDPGALVDSGLYPPNAQFTGVELWDATPAKISTDNAIVNGAYSVVITPATILQTNTYHLILNLVADFVDGEPANLPTFDIVVDSGLSGIMLGIIWGFDQVFAWLGFGAGMATATFTMVTSALTYYLQSLVMMASTFVMLGSMIIGFSIFSLDWGSRLAVQIVNITGIVLSLLNGTATVPGGLLTGLGNIWTLFGGANLVLFMPILILTYWLMSVDERVRLTGQNIFGIAIGDIMVAYGLISIMLTFAQTVYGIGSDWLRYLYGITIGRYI